LTEIVGADNGWLKAKHHFSIGHYGNPVHAPLGNLYVLNDDEIAPHSGFGLHYHSNVEIINYVREGVVTREDNLGNRGQTLAGDVQVMSAGTGIGHSERNEENVLTHMFQIWLTPRVPGGSPRWGTKPFPKADRAGHFIPLASGRAANEALSIDADAEVSGAVLQGGSITEYKFAPGDAAYLVPAVGSVSVNGTRVQAREGLIIREEASIRIEDLVNAEVMLIVTASERSQ
jgi:redox-sensitive bicupin YhaK (pirin superfamily)